jgi:hypothetical protein
MTHPRLRAALLGAMLAVAASVTASVVATAPAQAEPADPGEGGHCVLSLSEGGQRCFATYEASRAFAAAYAETGAPKADPTSARTGARAAAASTVVVAILFDWELFNPFGGSVILTGNAGNCTGTTADVDYAMPTLSARWTNDVSSYLTFSNCWLDLHDLTWFGGSSTGYHGSQSSLGSMNNDANSITVS